MSDAPQPFVDDQPLPASTNTQYTDGRWLLCATDLFTNTHTLEFYTAAMKVIWGSFNLFWWAINVSDMAHTPLQVILQHLMPQWAWGGIGVLVGTCHLLTPIARIRLRMTWLFFGFCFWSMITFMLIVSIPSNTGIPAYGGLSCVVGLCYLRLYLIHGELFNLRNFLSPMYTRLSQYWRSR